MTCRVPNPPWSDKALKSPVLKAYAKANDLPLPSGEELGAGHYGAVYPTDRDGIVLKVTSDPTEYGFIEAAGLLGDGDESDGIVHYYDMVKLPSTYRKRDVYAIWREEALEVGLPTLGFYGRKPEGMDDYHYRSFRLFDRRLDQFKILAAYARETLIKAKNPEKTYAEARRMQEWAFRVTRDSDVLEKDTTQLRNKITFYRGGQRVAFCLEACTELGLFMENEYLADRVGNALREFLERGFLLADVHSNNAGIVDRDGHKMWVITDPGHVVVLPEGWE